jgi:hypothetical protein
MRRVRTTGRALLGLGSALLCIGWSFPPNASEGERPSEPVLVSESILEDAYAPIEIRPEEEDPVTIELDPSPLLPPVLPSAGEDAPAVLQDATF